MSSTFIFLNSVLVSMQGDSQKFGAKGSDDGADEPVDVPQPEDFADADDDDAAQSSEYEKAKAEEENERLGWDDEEGAEAKEARDILDQRKQKNVKPRKGEDVKADIVILVVIAIVFAVIILLFNLFLGG